MVEEAEEAEAAAVGVAEAVGGMAAGLTMARMAAMVAEVVAIALAKEAGAGGWRDSGGSTRASFSEDFG